VTRHTHLHRQDAFHRPDRYQRHAGWLLGRFYRAVAADVAAALPDGARVLDVGTGPGRVPAAIAAARPDLHVDGLDPSPEMIEAAGGRDLGERVTFVVGEVGALPYPDATFDLVLSTLSQHHWPDPEAGFREIRRVLRPGGIALTYDMRPLLRRAAPAIRAAFGREPERSGTRGGLARVLLARLSVTT
jgi:ubiquinone/menaquinone biosynthesis C-methylase UbiE